MDGWIKLHSHKKERENIIYLRSAVLSTATKYFYLFICC